MKGKDHWCEFTRQIPHFRILTVQTNLRDPWNILQNPYSAPFKSKDKVQKQILNRKNSQRVPTLLAPQNRPACSLPIINKDLYTFFNDFYKWIVTFLFKEPSLRRQLNMNCWIRNWDLVNIYISYREIPIFVSNNTKLVWNNEEVCIDNLISICIVATVFKYTKRCITTGHHYVFVVFHKVQLNTLCELGKACKLYNYNRLMYPYAYNLKVRFQVNKLIK